MRNEGGKKIMRREGGIEWVSKLAGRNCHGLRIVTV